VSITTRTGDDGSTRLFSGEQVSKASARPSAYGDIDELGSILGLARSFLSDADLSEEVLYVQRQLFVVGAELATCPSQLGRLECRADEAFLAELDARRDRFEATIELPNGFVVPGGDNPGAATLDLARAVSRRCERRVVALHEAGEINNLTLLKWMNRLSDHLYLLARAAEGTRTMVKE
jgi:cob(I)alamin adenosyltransferase